MERSTETFTSVASLVKGSVLIRGACPSFGSGRALDPGTGPRPAPAATGCRGTLTVRCRRTQTLEYEPSASVNGKPRSHFHRLDRCK